MKFIFCRAILTFGLNALYGRHPIRKGVWGGAWNSSNAQSFIEYTVVRGYPVDSWEFGTVSVFSSERKKYVNSTWLKFFVAL